MSEAETLSAAVVAPEPAANPADPYEREAQTFPRLSREQVQRAQSFGRVEDLPKGAVLFRRGDRTVDFFLVLQGAIEIYDEGPDGAERVFTVHTERQFTGELDLFNDRDILVGGRMAADGRVARMNRVQFRRLLAAEPDIAETIMRAFILRRVGLIQHGQGAVTLVVSRHQNVGASLRIQRFLSRNGYPLRLLDVDGDAEDATATLTEHGMTAEDVPIVVCGRDRALKRPTNRQLGQCLGISEELAPDAVFDVAVVGAGPSGLAAAVYAASEGLSTLVLEAEAPGGQAGTSSKIEN